VVGNTEDVRPKSFSECSNLTGDDNGERSRARPLQLNGDGPQDPATEIVGDPGNYIWDQKRQLQDLGRELPQIGEFDRERPSRPGDGGQVLQPFDCSGVDEEILQQHYSCDWDYEAKGPSYLHVGN
jgi:hypothetical protein